MVCGEGLVPSTSLLSEFPFGGAFIGRGALIGGGWSRKKTAWDRGRQVFKGDLRYRFSPQDEKNRVFESQNKERAFGRKGALGGEGSEKEKLS